MNKRILIITIFLSNMVFATVIPVPSSQNSAKNNTINSLSNMATQNLYKRGLDKTIAQKKIADSLLGDENSNDLMSQNILKEFEAIKREDIINFVSSAALYGKEVDLSSYATLLSIMQKTTNIALEKDALEKLQNIALQNQTIKFLASKTSA